MFELNEESKGGSIYLQAKIVAAQFRLEEALRKGELTDIAKPTTETTSSTNSTSSTSSGSTNQQQPNDSKTTTTTEKSSDERKE